MFLRDFVADTVPGQIIDWIYGQIVGFLGDFLFRWETWALYGVGLEVATFGCGIEYQSGRGSIKATAPTAIKGFMAVGLFNMVPVELYKLSVSPQALTRLKCCA